MIKLKKIFFVTLIILLCATKVSSSIKDGLFATVGNKAITLSDVVNEIKIILILNNQGYSEEKRDQLHQIAISSIIKRSVKQIAIDENSFLEFNKTDLNGELTKLANNINVDLDTLKNICASNNLDFSLIVQQMKTELLWNSLIFQLYKDRLSINVEEIDDQLKSMQNKKELEEYLVSEIIIQRVPENEMEAEIKKLKNMIEVDGFEKVAMNLSISETSIKGGNLGWVSENEISNKFKSIISNTPVGAISDEILLPEGILIFKVKDKRKIKRTLNLEEEKNQLVQSEKNKILSMYSLSHYDKLRRSISIKIYNE